MYEKTNIDLSDMQVKKLVYGYRNEQPTSVRLSNKQLMGDKQVFLPKKELRKLEKARRKNTGVILHFDVESLKMIPQGGWIAPLLGSLIGTFLTPLAKTGVDYVKKSVSGNGFHPQGSGVFHPQGGMMPKKRKMKKHEGGFLLPLLGGLATSVLGSLLSGAVNSGVRDKAGLAQEGSGLTQLGMGGEGLIQLGSSAPKNYRFPSKMKGMGMSQKYQMHSGRQVL